MSEATKIVFPVFLAIAAIFVLGLFFQGSEKSEKARSEKWDKCVELQKVSNTPYEIFVKDCMSK